MIPVALGGGGQVKLLHIVPALRYEGNPVPVDQGRIAVPQHLTQMPQETKTGHVRTSVHPVPSHDFRSILVKGSHGPDRQVHGCIRCLSYPGSRTYDSHAQGLGKDQKVSFPAYFTSESAMECPPASTPPASLTFSLPPRRIWPRIFKSMASGKQTILRAVFTSPPMA